MKKKFKFTGFTLTELLVVVIVIGFLSAAVLPKFSKVIETRKTTEAEALMASIRTEQEKRCALDKTYLTKLSDMADIVKKSDTKNFALELQGSGILASSKSNYRYNLKMPSYADGRICCDGDDCKNLNKNYPSCEELRGKEDYTPVPESCVGTPEPEPAPCNDCSCAEYAAAHPSVCNPEPTPTCDTTHYEGEIYTGTCPADTCGKDQGKWHCGSDTNYAWKKQATSTCKYKPSDLKEQCSTSEGNGWRYTTYVCKNDVWTQQEWSDCEVEKCTDKNTECPSGEKWADCGHCETGGNGVVGGCWCYRFTWNDKTCSWDKQGAGGPPTYCSAIKSQMASFSCQCTEKKEEEAKYVWKREWSQMLMLAPTGSYDSASGLAADVNQTLLACAGKHPHSWSEITTTCASNVAAGAECSSEGSFCTKANPNNQFNLDNGQYCEFGGGNNRTGSNSSFPCNYHVSDSFMNYVKTTLCSSNSTFGDLIDQGQISWNGEWAALKGNRMIAVTGYVCAQQ